MIVQGARHLKHLSLGCIGEMADHAGTLLPLLAIHQSESLEALNVASVKEDPDSYGIIEFPYQHIRSFHNLHTLGIDYDYLGNDLLLNLAVGNKANLERLTIHVHGIEPDREKIRNMTWYHLVQANPSLQVSLNLIHSIDGAKHLLDILCPDMPLAHLRMFFCQDINLAAINFLAHNNCMTLRSLHIIDGMDEGQPYHYNMGVGAQDEEDPFVMLAWKCKNLQEFKMIGKVVNFDNVNY